MNKRRNDFFSTAVKLFAMFCCVASFADESMPSVNVKVMPPVQVAERYPGFLYGYLGPEAMPDGLRVVEAAPEKGSNRQQLDDRLNSQVLLLQGTKRWAWAMKDANLDFPQASGIFSCAANIIVDVEKMPHLVMLLRRSLTDFGLSTSAAKKYYQRPRPFLVNGQDICIPEQQESLKTSASYPSGHAAVGWGWALVFSTLLPDRAQQIMARGAAFGDSRAICNVHWQSDVVQGRKMAEAVLQALMANPVFKAELALARIEITGASKHLALDACLEEVDALGLAY